MIYPVNYQKWVERCDEVARANHCTHRDVGAVIIKGDDCVAVGRNTMPGFPLCTKGGCPRGKLMPGLGKPDYSDCVAVHAEMNAIMRAGTTQCNGSSLVVNSTPCHLCVRLARGANIAQIIYRDLEGHIHEQLWRHW